MPTSFVVNAADLAKILEQIRIAEAHAAGGDLATIIGPDANLLPVGLRTVDGSLNHLLPGQELAGAADTLFPRLLNADYRNFEPDPNGDLSLGDTQAFAPPGTPGAPPPLTNNNYALPGSVADAAPRIISNLISDQTVNNPAALQAALLLAGSGDPAGDAQAIRDAVQTLDAALAGPIDVAAELAALAAAQLAAAAAVAALPIAQAEFDAAQQAFDDAFALDAALDQAVIDLVLASAPGGFDAGELAAIAAAQIDADAAQLVLDSAQATLNAETVELGAANALITSTAADVVTAQATLDAASAAVPDVATAEAALANLIDATGLEISPDGSITIEARSPDIGLSPANSGWMTLFGQFFDHGLDLVTKGGNGTVYIPLQPDDPLYVEGGPNFMAVTRSTVFNGTDAENTTTPFVDQNQTYTSHPSHHVFLREYVTLEGVTVATGHLLDGANGGIANWAEVKAQSLQMLGIELTDFDVHNAPLLLTDPYGKFIPDPQTGFAQVVTAVDGNGIPTAWTSGTPANPVVLDAVGAVRTGHQFLVDIAHHAAPGQYRDAFGVLQNQTADLDPGVGDDGDPTTYDDEMLAAHFITGDGRGNENIGLTTVHTIFHAEHNRLVEANQDTILATGDRAFINEWLLVDLGANDPIPTDPSTLTWDGERLFQAARFVTEMQYQHLVFEEFGRRIQPNIDPFVFTNSADLDPAIVAEFAHAVYRFGHSMLTDTVDRLDNDLTLVNSNGVSDDPEQIGLIEAFLNPQAFTATGINDEVAAGAIVRGMSRQVANEIDEFVVEALRNNLVGLPLDLPAINIARGRETGTPSLNDARTELYEMTGHVDLKPYTSWLDFAQNIKHPLSIVNFIAAYGTHDSITSAATVEEKRDAAMLLVLGDGNDADGVTIRGVTYGDRLNFLNSTGSYTAENSGLNTVDLWIGGLAEEIKEFGGMLGSTFNYVFEYQFEHLQNGDRFYYLSRTQGMNLLNILEANTFTDLIMRNTDLGGLHATHLSAEIMEVPDMILELDPLVAQENYSGNAALDGTNPADRSLLDPTWDDPFQQAIENKVTRVLGTTDIDGNGFVDGNLLKFSGGEHVVLGGTEGNDIILGDKGIDTLWGDGGDDYLNAGMESDQVFGGDGDDIIEDPFGDDFLRGEGGDDVIVNSAGLDILFGGEGQDFIMAVTDSTEVFGGPGNDFILGGTAPDTLLGNEGDDWIEGGEGFDGISGENSELFFNSAIIGHDILNGQGNDTDYDAENGDDIMVQSAGIQRNNGMDGYDWAIHKGDENAADSDLGIRIFDNRQALILRDRFDSVEGLSGWVHDDILTGAARLLAGEGFDKTLNQAGVDRIQGLDVVIGNAGDVTPSNANAPETIILNQARGDAGGEIIIGGAGSDTIAGNLGDDILDGDAWLNVRIAVHASKDANGPTGPVLFSVDSLTSIVEAGPLVPAAWVGRQLASLMRTRDLNPGQLEAVREILNSDGTRVSDVGSRNDANDIDTAVFRGNLDEYTITENADGTVTVAHTAPVGNGGNLIDDGIDTLRNFERIQFADTTIDITTGPTTGITLNGTGGPDILNGTQFADAINGLAGNDIINGLGGDDILNGAGGADQINGGAGNDTINGGGGADQINGGTGNDIIAGGGGNDVITVGPGNDIVDGGAGTDTVIFNGNRGAFTFGFTNTGVLTVTETATGDVNQLVNVESLQFDNQTITEATAEALANITRLGAGAQVFNASTAADFVSGGAGADTLNGLAGNDVIIGDGGADTINGGGGDDLLNGSAGNDVVNGNGNNDTIVWDVGGGRDRINGGAGTDTVIINGNDTNEVFRVYARADAIAAGITGLNAASDIVITRNGTNNASVIAELANVEEIQINTAGGVNSVIPIGNFNPTSLNFNTITISGSEGADNIDITGLLSDHRIVFQSKGGNDTLLGALRPQDVIVLAAGTLLADYIRTDNDNGTTTLSDGVNSVTFASTSNPIIADENTVIPIDDEPAAGNTDANADAGSGTEAVADAGSDTEAATAGMTMNGTAADDLLNAGNADDVIAGAAGADTINAMGGNDLVDAGSGNDNILAGAGNDTIFAGEGDDRVFAGSGDDTVFGDGGNDFIWGEDGNDVIFGGAGNDRIWGGNGNDMIEGGDGNDVVNAGDGNDTILATMGDGNDIYDGGAGVDTLDLSGTTANAVINLAAGLASSDQIGTDFLAGIENAVGGYGSDTITASDAANVMTGGYGADSFVFNSAASANGDQITDFQAGDRIDLTGFDADPMADGSQQFTLVDQAVFSAAGQISFHYEQRDGVDYTVVEGNVTGDEAPDFAIDILGQVQLTRDDFNGVIAA